MARAFFVNNQECYGCKTCTSACAVARQTGYQTYMRRVMEIVQDEPQVRSFYPYSCNHCEKPVCLERCPVDAYTKLDNGVVIQDHEKCIGCKTCIEVCPYKSPVFHEEEGKVYKCDMCNHRMENNELPYCVEACPGSNIEAGEFDELQSRYPNAKNTIEGVLPEPEQTNPSLLIEVDSQFNA